MGGERMFPIDELRGPKHLLVGRIPWRVIAPHDKQAQANHGGQTLERLAERGGLDATEALAVLRDVSWRVVAALKLGTVALQHELLAEVRKGTP